MASYSLFIFNHDGMYMLSIFQSGDWETVKVAISLSDHAKYIPTSLNDDQLDEAFAGPCSLAYAILNDNPAILLRRVLRILILNPDATMMAHGLDVFGMLPALLGDPDCLVHVCMAGKRPGQLTGSDSTYICDSSNTVSIFHVEPSQFVSSNTIEDNFDLVFYLAPSSTGSPLPYLTGISEVIASDIPVLLLPRPWLLASLVIRDTPWSWASQYKDERIPTRAEVNSLFLSAACLDDEHLSATIAVHPRWANVIDNRGHGLVHIATMYGNTEALHALNSAGADFDVLDANGLSPLHYAISQQCYHTADTLLTLGADPDIRLPNKKPPVLDAAMRKDVHAVLLLLESGANPNEEDGDGVSLTDMLPTLLSMADGLFDPIRCALRGVIEYD